MKSLLTRPISLAWAKASAALVYRPVIFIHAALAYLNLAAALILNFAGALIAKALIIRYPDLNHNAVWLVVGAAGTEVAYTSLFLGLAGCVMCRAYRARCGRPSRFVLSASCAAWTSFVLAVFSPAIMSA
jgi:hypothetical protein